MPLRLALYLVVLVLLAGGAIVAQGVPERERSAPSVRAVAFLAALPPALRAAATAPFDDADRESWHYVPQQRSGISLQQLDGKQRARLDALLAALLTEEGLRKTRGVITLEGVLAELGADPRFRDAGLYFVRIFGDPAGPRPWGLSFEGHHLSLNYTSQTGVTFSGTPAFFGANPHRVPRGKHKGLRLLAREEDDARALVDSLSGAQRTRAVLAARAPAEIVTRARGAVRLDTFEGIPASALEPKQGRALRRLIEVYVRNHRDAVATDFLKRIDGAGFGKVHFAWAGSTKAGQPHYYRIHGPTFLIEYVNVQNGANHSHTVLRDFAHDFGRDWLAEHFRREHAGDR